MKVKPVKFEGERINFIPANLVFEILDGREAELRNGGCRDEELSELIEIRERINKAIF